MRKYLNSMFTVRGLIVLIAVFAWAALCELLGWRDAANASPLLFIGALSADTPRVYELGNINAVPVKASTSIYEGAAVGMTSGYARGLVAGDAFVGFAERKADNSAVATDGAIYCRVISKGLIQLTISSVAVTDIGSPVYASADGTFTLTKGPNSYIGVVYRYVTTDTAIVAFIAQGVADGEKAAGGSLTNTHILVGNGSGVAADVALSGDATLANTGAMTIANNAITAAKVSDLTLTLAKLTSAELSKVISYGASSARSAAASAVTSHTTSSSH